MLSHKLFEAYRIDNMNRKWSVRVLFLVLLFFSMSLYFFPLGDSDLSLFIDFCDRVINNPQNYSYLRISDIPLTRGNLIYFAYLFSIIVFLIIGTVVYSAFFIRDYRINSRNFSITENANFAISIRNTVTNEENQSTQEDLICKVSNLLPECKPIGYSQLFFRVVIISFWIIVLILPLFLLFNFLFIIFILIVPCLMLSVTYYISGDKNLGDSLVAGFKQIRGNMLEYMTGIIAIAFSFVATDFFISLVADSFINSAISYSLSALALSYFALVLGRFMGLKHCMLNDFFSHMLRNKQNM